jgi:hypothetical protein
VPSNPYESLMAAIGLRPDMVPGALNPEAFNINSGQAEGALNTRGGAQQNRYWQARDYGENFGLSGIAAGLAASTGMSAAYDALKYPYFYGRDRGDTLGNAIAGAANLPGRAYDALFPGQGATFDDTTSRPDLGTNLAQSVSGLIEGMDQQLGALPLYRAVGGLPPQYPAGSPFADVVGGSSGPGLANVAQGVEAQNRMAAPSPFRSSTTVNVDAMAPALPDPEIAMTPTLMGTEMPVGSINFNPLVPDPNAPAGAPYDLSAGKGAPPPIGGVPFFGSGMDFAGPSAGVGAMDMSGANPAGGWMGSMAGWVPGGVGSTMGQARANTSMPTWWDV